MRKYPIGLQSFRKIREGGYLYVDKTEIIHQLVTTGEYYFLSRPRRFGKSLLVDTIEELFSGSKELFEGLWIYDQWDWTNTNPVFKLRLSKIPYQKLGLYDALFKELDNIAAPLGIDLIETDLKSKFWELIEKGAKIGKVVILIDEYDKALIDYLDNPDMIAENRSVFKQFYSVLKDADQFIRLLLLTGVSRFSKVSLFSDLNNLRDITLNGQFDDLVGITQQELETNFSQEITEMQQQDAQILEKIRDRYNGYTWGRSKKVYNPFSLLNFMADREFNNYWFESGTPSFFYEAIQRNPAMKFPSGPVLAGPEALIDLLGQYTVYEGQDKINPLTLMFQTGYLTIKDYNAAASLYTLDFPNEEVRESMRVYLLSAYSFAPIDTVRPNVFMIGEALRTGDVSQVLKLLDTLFVNIPSSLWIGAKEQFYHAIIQNTFGLLNIMMESEKSYAGTRPDITVFTPTHIYVFEFKLDKTASEALNQILDKNYFRPFQADDRKKIAIGINFSSEKKAISEYEVKELDF
ncbi:PD-(D/E)XK nuclease superfamily protein [bacterium A37T11]|nr:PD-(D/E)XK nuclease superfamily protein [bacterium A37T11]